MISNSINLICEICGVANKNAADWELHVTSERHVNKVKTTNPSQCAQIPPPANINNNYCNPTINQISSPQIVQIPPLIPYEELQDIQQRLSKKKPKPKFSEFNQPKQQEFSCQNCQVVCNSQDSYTAHLLSKKHRKNKDKFHLYPGISKDYVKRKFNGSFVRAGMLGNEFVDDSVIFYCKKCDCKMNSKCQLEVHMSSNLHKLNHPPEAVIPQVLPTSVVNAPQQLFNFDNSAYGYGYRNWDAERNILNQKQQTATMNLQTQQNSQQAMQQKIAEAKKELFGRFPYYALAQQQDIPIIPETIPLPTPQIFQTNILAPQPVAMPLNYNQI
ncbi:unnamed protein product [Diamesa tonsa]